ncbi:MAG: hypothetical protein CME28_05900 [Gemmatimonadetes bacterium]|nr:hypothetical protein [Gemmatimonadota bacterium]|tara:strand:+ start:460 stop:864 length:405 start_codon:yes stop_codon:yes gene_type:complete
MKDDMDTVMMKALAGELNSDEASRLARALEADGVMRARWQRLESLQTDLRSERADSFGPFFAARVTARAQQGESMVDGLMWMFRSLAPTATLVALIIAFNNWSDYSDIDGNTSLMEAIFAIEPISLNVAYAMEE